MDVNGDGGPDLVTFAGGNLSVFGYGPAFGGNDFITSVLNGLGASTGITYYPLAYASGYARAYDGPGKTWGRGSPVFDVFSAIWVVHKAASSAPLAGESILTQFIEFRRLPLQRCEDSSGRTRIPWFCHRAGGKPAAGAKPAVGARLACLPRHHHRVPAGFSVHRPARSHGRRTRSPRCNPTPAWVPPAIRASCTTRRPAAATALSAISRKALRSASTVRY
jgi:hypothetical protein